MKSNYGVYMDYAQKTAFLRDAKALLKKVVPAIRGAQETTIATSKGGDAVSGEQSLRVVLGTANGQIFGLTCMIGQVHQLGRASDGVSVLVQPMSAKVLPGKPVAQTLARGTIGTNRWLPQHQEITVQNVIDFVNKVAGEIRRENTPRSDIAA
ncbi:hypothetical protein [Acidithiobacillus ferrianus]|uniref:hypothetical protein n=1 Tax=Acidithiobacillus ferrianus TaxID=2678518 RepID=UPI0034E41072